MKLSQFKEVIKLMVKNKTKTPLIAVGVHGIGKTQTVLDVAEELNVPVSILRIGSKNDVGDLLGILTLSQMKIEGENLSVYAKPVWYKTIENGGILFLDELNRCKPELADAIMQLLGERQLDVFKLHPDTIIVGAVNPDTEDYDVNPINDALADRCVFVKVSSSLDEIIQYAIAKKWDPQIIDMIASSEGELFVDKAFSLFKKDYTPRGIRQLQDFLPIIRELPSVEPDIVVGCIGPTGYKIWKNNEILKSVPSAKEYINNPEKYDVKNLELVKQRTLVVRLLSYIEENSINDKVKKAVNILVQNVSEPILGFIFRYIDKNVKLLKLIDFENNEKLNKIAAEIRKTLHE